MKNRHLMSIGLIVLLSLIGYSLTSFINPTITTAASAVLAGQDLWQTPSGSIDIPPGDIPPGFFDPGSDPFSGEVSVKGNRIDPGQFGNTDTIVERKQDANLPSVPSSDTIPIELVALSLKSVAPITVTYSGIDPELWDLEITLSPTTPSVGEMTINRESDEGGTFDSIFDVTPRLTFTRREDGALKIVDSASQINLNSSCVPWTFEFPPEVLQIPGVTSNFSAGTDPSGPLLSLLQNPDNHLLLSPATPLRAIGVIKNAGGGDAVGSLTFIKPFVIGVTLRDSSVNPGDTITLIENLSGTGIGVGDLVAFDLNNDADGPLAQNLDKLADGTVITSDLNRNVKVDSSSPVTIKSGAQVNGNVTVNGGILIVRENATINGKLKGKKEPFILIEENSTINGDVKSNDVTVYLQDSSRVNGNIDLEAVRTIINNSTIEGSVKNNLPIKQFITLIAVATFTDNTIEQNLSAANVDDLTIINNTINNNLKAKNNENVTITGNSINGKLEISGTTGTCVGDASNNTVTGSVDPCP